MSESKPLVLEHAIVQIEARPGIAAGAAVAALPRVGRLPLKAVTAHATHLLLTGDDGQVEMIGSPEEPLNSSVLHRVSEADGLVFVELDADTGLPTSVVQIRT